MTRDVTVTFDDGSSHVYRNVPDGASPDIVQSRAEIEFKRPVRSLDGGKIVTEPVSGRPSAPISSDRDMGFIGNTLAGQLRGAAGIGATLIAPTKAFWKGVGQIGSQQETDDASSNVGQKLLKGVNLLKDFGNRTLQERKNILQDVDQSLAYWGADKSSAGYGIGKFGSEIAGTAGIGPAQMSARFIPRALEGAFMGGAGTAMVSPEDTASGALTGAGVSSLLPPILKYGANGVGRVSDYLTGNLPKIRSAELMRDVAGPQLADIQRAWSNAPAGLTAAQAAASVQNDVIPALGAISALNKPAEYRLIAEGQQAARDATMGAMARGSTAETAALSRDWLSKATAAELVPIRDSILQKMRETGKTLDELIPLLSAKEATYVAALRNQGRMATEAAQQGVIAQGSKVPRGQIVPAAIPENQGGRLSTGEPSLVSGKLASGELPKGNYPRDPMIATQKGDELLPFANRGTQGEYTARVGEYSGAANELGNVASGLRAEADALRKKISELPSTFTAAPVREAVAAAAARTVNPAEEAVMNAVGRALQRAGDDPVAIAEVRKLGVNQIMGDLLGADKLSKTDAAAALSSVKNLIDKQLGTEIVKRYFKPYSKKLEYRSSLELADKLRQLQKENPSEFIKVMRGDNPDLVAKYGDWPTIQEALGARRFGKATSLAAENQRDIDMAARASGAATKLGNIVDNDKFGFTIPWGLSPKAALINRTLQSIEASLNKETKDLISEAMMSGKSANELMSLLPAHERSVAMKWIAEGGPARWAGRSIPGVISASRQKQQEQ